MILKDEPQKNRCLAYHIKRADFLILSRTGYEILKLSDGKNCVDDIVKKLCSSYVDTPHEKISKDVLSFVNKMVKIGFLEVV